MEKKTQNFYEINTELQRLYNIEVVVRIIESVNNNKPIIIDKKLLESSTNEIRVQMFNKEIFGGQTYKYSVLCKSPIIGTELIYVVTKSSKDIHQYFDNETYRTYYLNVHINSDIVLEYLISRNIHYSYSDNTPTMQDGDGFINVDMMCVYEKEAMTSINAKQESISKKKVHSDYVIGLQTAIQEQYNLRIAEVFVKHHYDNKPIVVNKRETNYRIYINKEYYKGFIRSSYRYSCIVPTPIEGYSEFRCVTDWETFDLEDNNYVDIGDFMIDFAIGILQMMNMDIVVKLNQCTIRDILFLHYKDVIMNAMDNLRENEKHMEDVKKLHRKFQNEYDRVVIGLISGKKTITLNKSLLKKSYPKVKYNNQYRFHAGRYRNSTLNEKVKYMMTPYRYCYTFNVDFPLITNYGSTHLTIKVDSSPVPTFDRYGLEVVDHTYGFQLDPSNIVTYVNHNNIRYEIV